MSNRVTRKVTTDGEKWQYGRHMELIGVQNVLKNFIGGHKDEKDWMIAIRNDENENAMCEIKCDTEDMPGVFEVIYKLNSCSEIKYIGECKKEKLYVVGVGLMRKSGGVKFYNGCFRFDKKIMKIMQDDKLTKKFRKDMIRLDRQITNRDIWCEIVYHVYPEEIDKMLDEIAKAREDKV